MVNVFFFFFFAYDMFQLDKEQNMIKKNKTVFVSKDGLQKMRKEKKTVDLWLCALIKDNFNLKTEY